MQRLLEALGSAAGTKLPAIVTVLGWLQSPAVDRALTALLGDTEGRALAMEAVVRHGRRVLPLLLEQLESDDRATRLAAVTALGRVGDRRATAALLKVLDDDPELLVATAGALARIGDPQAFEPLVGLVSHRDAAVRLSAIGALNSIGHPDMPRRVVSLLSSTDARTRESAVRIAGYFGYREAADPLLGAALNDPDEPVRRAALEHLPYLDDGRVIDVLTAALQSDTPKTRMSAVRALARLDDGAATAVLRRALDDTDSWVRYHAVRALGERRDAAAADTLIRLADQDAATPVRIAAVEAAGAIATGMAAHLARWASDPEDEIAGAALHGLGRAAEEQTLRPRLEAWRTAAAPRRAAAVRALAAHGSEGAVTALEWTASAEQDRAIARLAIEGLGRVAEGRGSAAGRAVAALLTLLAESRLREVALPVLSRLPAEAIADMRGGLSHAVPAVRLGTIEALARLRHPDATAVIEGALELADPELRASAAQALGRLGSPATTARLASLAAHDPSKAVRRAAASALVRLRHPAMGAPPPRE
jgi:HEAT repeat protein